MLFVVCCVINIFLEEANLIDRWKDCFVRASAGGLNGLQRLGEEQQRPRQPQPPRQQQQRQEDEKNRKKQQEEEQQEGQEQEGQEGQEEEEMSVGVPSRDPKERFVDGKGNGWCAESVAAVAMDHHHHHQHQHQHQCHHHHRGGQLLHRRLEQKSSLLAAAEASPLYCDEKIVLC